MEREIPSQTLGLKAALGQGYRALSATDSVSASDAGKILVGNNGVGVALSLPNSAAVNAGLIFAAWNLGAGAITISRFGANTINTIAGTGATSVTVPQYACVILMNSGAGTWYQVGGEGALTLPALTGDVTSTAGTAATTIAANAVSDAKLRQGAATSVIGRSANSTGNVADIAASASNDVLRRSGTTLGFGTIDTASIGSGTLAAGRMPALTGDVTSSAGAVATTLANTAVTPGSYTNTNLTVDSKGRITAAANGSTTGNIPLFAQTSNLLIANTASASTIFGTGVGSLTLGAGVINTLGLGVRLIAKGGWGTDAVAPTITFTFLVNGAVKVTSETITLPGSNTGGGSYFLDLILTTSTTGAAGACQSVGTLLMSDRTSPATAFRDLSLVGGLSAVDLTGTLTLDVQAQFNTADTDNKLYTYVGLLQALY